jgi:PadR family transcriptional regulator, regulatory protein PadR
MTLRHPIKSGHLATPPIPILPRFTLSKHLHWIQARRTIGSTQAANSRIVDDFRQISAYCEAVRRKPGCLLPLEIAICEAARELRERGDAAFHGYELAKMLRRAADARLLTAYGTLYRALGRLEHMGLLESRWEDPAIPARENRPGRRLYTLTAAGETAVNEATRATALASRTRPRRLAPA